MKRLFVVALLVAGCSGDDDATVTAEDADGSTTTTTTIPGVEGLRLLVASGDEVLRVVDGRIEPVAEVDGEVAVAYGDGSGAVVAQVDGELVDLRSGEPMTLEPPGLGEVLLFDLATVDGAPSALYGLRDDSEGEAMGDVALLALTSGEHRPLTTGYAPEYHAFAGSIGGGMLSISAYSDLTETVTLYPIEDGVAEPVWSPTIDLAYNAAPLVLDAILSADGSRIAWLSGPENGEGQWEVVVAGVEGLEQTRLPLELLDGESGVRLDFDGEHVLVSVAADEEPAAPVLIDIAGGAQRRIDGLAGVATFD